MQERLQKILSTKGIASRRKAEEYIERGLVKVNGRTAKLGDKADPVTDSIEVDGKVLSDREDMLYYVMNKPVGVVTSNVVRDESKASEAHRDPTVRDLLPAALRGKVAPVGRLDKDSSGLLLFTNDGVLSYRLTHPSFNHEKEYEVTVDRAMPGAVLKKIAEGVSLKGVQTKPARTFKLSPSSFTITLTEGRNRQIRRMCQQTGFTVKTLKRIRIMTLRDEKMAEGDVRPLTQKERSALLQSVGL